MAMAVVFFPACALRLLRPLRPIHVVGRSRGAGNNNGKVVPGPHFYYIVPFFIMILSSSSSYHHYRMITSLSLYLSIIITLILLSF